MRFDRNSGLVRRTLGLLLALATHPAFAEPFAYIAHMGDALDVIDVRTGEVRDSIAVGETPFGATINPRGTRVYVQHYLASPITIVDTRSATVEATIDPACGSHWLAVPRDDAFIYVANDDGTVCKVDTASGAVAHTFAVDGSLGPVPPQIAVSPDGTRLYATHATDGALDVFDTTTYARIASIPTGYPEGVVVSHDGSRVYVTSPFNQLLMTIDAETNTLIRATPMCPGDSYMLALSPDDRSLFVACSIGGVQRLDVASGAIVATIAPTLGFSGLAITPDGSTLYAPALNSGGVTVISAETDEVTDTLEAVYPASFYGFIGSPQPVALVAGSDAELTYVDTFDGTIAGHAPIGQAPSAVALSPDGRRAYVANYADHSVSVVSVPTQTTIATIPVADTPFDLVVTPDGRHVYAANGSISVIDTTTNTVAATIHTPYDSSLAVAVSADGSWVYSTNLIGIDVASTETNAVVTTIQTNQPSAFALSPDGSVLYALAGNIMYEVSTLTQSVIGTFGINAGPVPNLDAHSMAISPRGDRLYLPDRSGNSLVVIDIALGDTVAIVYCDGAPTDVAVTQDGAHVFMTVPERNAVEDVETATNTVVGSSPAIGAAAIANFVEPRPNRVFRSGFD